MMDEKHFPRPSPTDGIQDAVSQIENVLMRHPDIKEFVILTRENASAAKQLDIYIVPAHDPLPLSLQRKVAEIEKEPELHRSFYQLPNGLYINQQNVIQTNMLFSAIFGDKVYLRHNIMLPPGACIFDVGANIGLFTLFVHLQCSNACVYAFEPIESTYNILERNIRLYELPVNLFHCGLLRETKTLPLIFFPHLSGISGLFSSREKNMAIFKAGIASWSPSRQGASSGEALPGEIDLVIEDLFSKSEAHLCQFRTCSDIIGEHHIEHIDLLKIDVEESELEVLLGIREHDWQKIRQIIVEVHNRHLLQEVLTLLTSHGYDVVVEAEGEFQPENDIVERADYQLFMVYAIRRVQNNGASFEMGRTTYKLTSRPLVSASERSRFFRAKAPSYRFPSKIRHSIQTALPDLQVPLDIILVSGLIDRQR